MKRSRVDIGLSKEQYADDESKDEVTHGFGQHAKASDEVMRGRRVVKAVVASTRLTELKRHTYALNQSFYQGIKLQSSQNAKESWLENMKEYLSYAQEIDGRYGDHRGVLLTFGSGDCGQLGHGVEEDIDMCVKFPRPVQALSMHRIARVACGGLHTMALTHEGSVFTWGCNDDGALGRIGDENLPGQVTGFPEGTTIVTIVGGDCHTTAVAVDGSVFTWGSYKDKEGKLWCDGPSPNDTFKKKQLTPYLVPTLANVVDVKSGSSHNLARCADGHVYSWGLGEMGNLGRPVSTEIRDAHGEYKLSVVFNDHLTPQLVKLNGKPFGCKALGAGSYHSLFVANDSGGIYSCGLNNYGQLGLGHDVNQTELQLVEALGSKNGLFVEGGTHHSVVLVTDGTLYTFGRGDSGQLGTLDDPGTGAFKDSPQEIKVPGVTGFRAVACGSNHALAVTDQDAIYSWGYGDMLALGNGVEKDELKPRRIDWTKTKFGAAKILQVAAGGQHSAVVAEKATTT
ncbi:hypothetical protein H257_12165 [Aphanomyces astaci]|uniref:RCC1-like domain-containing protein n=2 Tax=Aphanomyces astaci TaxID=112090 RepID=W4FZ97_APHAT|nr:hypothetical protein H257_12165 [Aphanomyces astaci]ETV72802.1 hypothetical protein H257_12165 [Aphanomyces astaci]|eukprot:XP_009837588.1 hypothetical protein H257_12165 [Aphanomyces astaci]